MTATFNPRGNIVDALLGTPDRTITVRPPRRPKPERERTTPPERESAITEAGDKSGSEPAQPNGNESEGEESHTTQASIVIPKAEPPTAPLVKRATNPESEILFQPVSEPPIPGAKKGNLRIITVTLPANAREILDRQMKATGDSRGQVVMDALRATYSQIAKEFAVDDADADGPFGSPRVIKRRRELDDPRALPLYVAEPEARGIGELRERVVLSISAIVTEALERRHGT